MSWDFLVQLGAERHCEPSRPLLFVAHSLGGIFVKEALRRSESDRSHHVLLRDIFHSTIEIVFFGTPHGGADPLGLPHRILKGLAKVVGFEVNESIINSLLPSSERLRELRDEFHPVAQKRNWDIHSFQEEIDVSALGRKVQNSSEAADTSRGTNQSASFE